MAGSATSDCALVLRQVSKTFGATRALQQVDFELRRGEVHALVGQNGSGKSTLIKLLAGFHEPDTSTEIECCGQRIPLGDARAAHEAGLRFVHQDLGVVTSFNAMDNLALGYGYASAARGHISWRKERRYAEAALAEIGYDIDVTVPLSNLAPVERTAVAIARALREIQPGSSVLVLDEPTATMPSPEIERMFKTVNALRANGESVLYVSHHLDEIYEIADRITVLRDGKVIDTRTPDDLPRRELVELMIGSVPDDLEASEEITSDRVALSVRNVSSRQLSGFSLDVHEAEIVGVAGITSSGREELCDVLFGGRPRTGSVEVRGRLIEPMRPDLMVNNRVGLVPANRREAAMFEPMSVRENFTAPDVSQFWRGLMLRQRAERAEVKRLIERLQVKTPSGEAGIDALSGGNQQKVIVGRWLRLEPAVLLLDDPTQGVDVGAQRDIHQLIKASAAAGTAVVVASTDETELEQLCHRVVILRNGRIAAVLGRSAATAAKIAHETLVGQGPGKRHDSNEVMT